MRISDLSSDVCSSDLPEQPFPPFENRVACIEQIDTADTMSPHKHTEYAIIGISRFGARNIVLIAEGLSKRRKRFLETCQMARPVCNELDRKSTRLNSSH